MEQALPGGTNYLERAAEIAMSRRAKQIINQLTLSLITTFRISITLIIRYCKNRSASKDVNCMGWGLLLTIIFGITGILTACEAIYLLPNTLTGTPTSMPRLETPLREGTDVTGTPAPMHGPEMPANQNTIQADGVTPLKTGDSVDGIVYPTMTAIKAVAELSIAQQDLLFIDSDSFEGPSSGDTLLYIIRVENTSSISATNVVVTGNLDPNITLQIGSVRIDESIGMIVTGNNHSDTSIEVNFDTFPVGTIVQISYLAQINEDIDTSSSIINQASISFPDQVKFLSNDPDIPLEEVDGTTVTTLVTIPTSTEPITPEPATQNTSVAATQTSMARHAAETATQAAANLTSVAMETIEAIPTATITPQSSPSINERIGQEVDNLELGTIGFTPPQIMNAGITKKILASIVQSTEEDIISQLEESLLAAQPTSQENPIVPKFQQIDVTSQMNVQLIADSADFKIVSLSPSKQPIGQTTSADWQWSVTPLRAGSNKILTLSVDAIITIKHPDITDPQEYTRSVQVLNKTINVTVNPLYTVQVALTQYWQGFTATLAAIALALYTAISRKRPSHTPTPAMPNAKLQSLQAALLSAFPSETALAQLTQYSLSQNLNQIAGGEDLEDRVFNLLTWTEANGHTAKLAQAAYTKTPTNNLLKQYIATYHPNLLQQENA